MSHGDDPIGAYLQTLTALAEQGGVLRAAAEAADFAGVASWRATTADLAARLEQQAAPLVGFVPQSAADLATVRTIQRLMGVAREAESFWESWNLGMNTMDRSGAAWVAQMIGNAPALAAGPTVGGLAGALAGVPAVIVSAGPSLARNIERLRGIGDKALVIAMNRTAGALDTVGVSPHFTVVGDARDLTSQLALPDGRAHQRLVLRASCHPAVAAMPAGRRVWYASSVLHEQWLMEKLGDPTVLRSWGSVAHVAFDLAVHLGCHPIILIGQDLALDGARLYGDLTHTSIDHAPELFRISQDGTRLLRNVPLHLEDTPWGVGERLIEVDAWGGGVAHTTPLMKAYLDGFSTLCAEQAGQRTVINATEGGASIPHTMQAPLAEALASACRAPFDIAGRLDARLDAGVEADSGALLGEVAATLEQVRRLATEGRAAAQAASRERAKDVRALGAVEKRLAKALPAVQSLLVAAKMGTFRPLLERQAALQTMAQSIEWSRDFNGAVADTAAELLPLVRAAGS